MPTNLQRCVEDSDSKDVFTRLRDEVAARNHLREAGKLVGPADRKFKTAVCELRNQGSGQLLEVAEEITQGLLAERTAAASSISSEAQITRAIALLSFCPGGIEFGGRRFVNRHEGPVTFEKAVRLGVQEAAVPSCLP
jgi:hypothetical protein